MLGLLWHLHRRQIQSTIHSETSTGIIFPRLLKHQLKQGDNVYKNHLLEATTNDNILAAVNRARDKARVLVKEFGMVNLLKKFLVWQRMRGKMKMMMMMTMMKMMLKQNQKFFFQTLSMKLARNSQVKYRKRFQKVASLMPCRASLNSNNRCLLLQGSLHPQFQCLLLMRAIKENLKTVSHYSGSEVCKPSYFMQKLFKTHFEARCLDPCISPCKAHGLRQNTLYT